MSVGETGCQRTVSPFSRSWIRHCSRSRSDGRRASAPPRRQAVSVCSRRISVSSSGSSPVVAATWLISASRVSFTARRVDGRRRGLATLRAGLSRSSIRPSSSALPVEAAQRGDQVLGRAAAAAGVAAGHRVRLDVRHQLPDLRRRRLVQAPGAPLLDHPVPVGAVRLAGAVGDRGRTPPARTRRRWARPAAARGRRRSSRDSPIDFRTSSAASTAACWGAAGEAGVAVMAFLLARAGARRGRGWPGPPRRGSRRRGRPRRGARPAAPGRRPPGRSGGAARPGS